MLYKLDNVCFSYTPGISILDRVSMDILENELTFLRGANGSGKTTLCRILSGLNTGYQGSVLYHGQELKNVLPHRIADEVMYLKQEGSLNIVAATPEEDLKIRQDKFNDSPNPQHETDRQTALQRLDLLSLKDTPVWELSAGQIKRISIAGLLLNWKHFWILDEPCIGLDSNMTGILRNLLQQRKEQNLGALIIDHTGLLMDTDAHNQYLIENGRITRL